MDDPGRPASPVFVARDLCKIYRMGDVEVHAPMDCAMDCGRCKKPRVSPS